MISDFLDKLLRLPISYFESKTTGDFMQRIYDHQRIDEFLGGRALTMPFDIFNILVFGIVLSFFRHHNYYDILSWDFIISGMVAAVYEKQGGFGSSTFRFEQERTITFSSNNFSRPGN
jgi:hypothetical protein